VRYFEDKAVDPPKRRTRGKGRVIKVRDDRKDTTSDPACHCSPGGDNGLCDICGYGRGSYIDNSGHDSPGHEGARK
jgi:hypothetical protein